VLGPIGRRYDAALVFPFEESWDVLRDMAVARYEAIVTRDLDTVVSVIQGYRQRMRDLANAHAALPEVARYMRPE